MTKLQSVNYQQLTWPLIIGLIIWLSA
ncbi:2-oxoglutarate translocator, partial [Lactiplantibacillus plantarum]|nr:2-oxoglutarate translocator [Lactiplantibacillus plantarum]